MSDIFPWTILLAATLTTTSVEPLPRMCSFIALSIRIDTAIGMGLRHFVSTATTASLGAVSACPDPAPCSSGGIPPCSCSYSRFRAFVQVVEMALERFYPGALSGHGHLPAADHRQLRHLGVSLFMVIRKHSFLQSLAYGLGPVWAGCWRFCSWPASARLRFADVPRGLPAWASPSW